MDLIKKLETLLTIRFMENTPRDKYLLKFSLEPSLSRHYKHGFKKKAKLTFLQSGLSMILDKKLKFFLCFGFYQK